ncbi:MAG: Nif3-like dinuclear metal center hexameric protein [Clostridia bacterium]|nr:Nif3-like dinuclear metal center hexameric protein [Clostridia bacterium]
MKFYDLYKKLSQLYPETLSCEWDNDGIMCAVSLDDDVRKVLITLDVTSDAVEYAIENGFDTIISHHPLVFKSQNAINPLNYVQKKLIDLIQAGVRVMSFHTRLDAAEGGVNDTLCRLLGLDNVIVDPVDPIGRVGELTDAMELSTFADTVKGELNAPVVLYSGNKMVKKIYVVGGDGKDLITRAISMGADTLLTGRGSYNTSVEAEEMGLNIIEAGHFYTENPVCCSLEEDVLLIDSEIYTEIFFSNKIKLI